MMEVIGRALRVRQRLLSPGETFICSNGDAKIWIIAGRAKLAREMIDLPPPPPELIELADKNYAG
jgi:hypothetical protein